MNYLKKSISTLLFITTVTASLTVGNTFRISNIKQKVEEFEPVIVEQVQYVEPDTSKIEELEATIEELKLIIEQLTVIEEPVVVEEPIVLPTIDCALDEETQHMIYEKCEEYEIDFAFAMAVIFRESSFNPNANSGSSVGLMQINKINHPKLSEQLGITDFFDPEQNVTAGLHMLHKLFLKHSDPSKVLMAYNLGETGARNLWEQGIYTTGYVESVLQQAEIYEQEIQERMG